MNHINNMFGSKICWRIISFFVQNPTAEISQTYLIKKIKIAKLSASKWLKLLEENEFLNKKQMGKMNLYALNKESIFVKQVKVLHTLSILLPKLPHIKSSEIYLFGSAARGEDDEKSDIDILVIGGNTLVINKLKEIDKRIKVTFFNPLKWSRMARDDPAFYERVEKDKIELV